MAIDIIARGMIESSKNDISQLFDITKGGEIVSNESSYTISNAVDYPLLGLNLYGKSTQDGTPTPENPVDIVSVGDNGFDIITKDDKHFNLLSVRDNGSDIITKQPVSIVSKIGEKATFTVAASGTGLKYQWQWSADGGKTWKNTSTTAASYSITAIAAYNGYMYRCVVTDSNGKSVISDEATLYVLADDCEVKTSSIATDALPLCGIPVESGGNYTDSNGQQWIADELIYNADGTGKIKKYTNKIIFNGSEDWKLTSNVNHIYLTVAANLKPKYVSNATKAYLFSTKYSAVSVNDIISLTKSSMTVDSNGNFIIRDERFVDNVAGLKADMAANNLRVLYALATPQEIELTSAEVDALRNLQTFDGVTNISNSAGADMSVKYCTNKALSEYVLPIFNGMQAQIDELRAAVLSLGGNI